MAFTVISDPHASHVRAFDAEWLEGSPVTIEVDLVPTVPEAETASGAWLWVRADVEPGGASAVNFKFGDAILPVKRLNVGDVEFFTMFVPLHKGRFNITATATDGGPSVANLIVYPQAVQ